MAAIDSLKKMVTIFKETSTATRTTRIPATRIIRSIAQMAAGTASRTLKTTLGKEARAIIITTPTLTKAVGLRMTCGSTIDHWSKQTGHKTWGRRCRGAGQYGHSSPLNLFFFLLPCTIYIFPLASEHIV